MNSWLSAVARRDVGWRRLIPAEDKPLKYPHMFRAAQVMVLNKVDLLPYVQFDTDRCLAYARRVNPRLRVFQVSAIRGDGFNAWYAWLREQRASGIAEG